ncbi:MAG TPA: hypothetical protein VGW33_09360 [Terriglobia bacterium]|nr:hypothetical protein [Terriglobia bacterium]
MKVLTRKQLESRKAQAVRFARDVREDDELADEIEDESIDDYAEHRRIKIQNPQQGEGKMSLPSRRELVERIEQLESDNESLQSRLDEIGDLASGDEEEDEDDDQGE